MDTRVVVITGPSGAGKTLALHTFEDAGYFTSDNLPPELLPGFAQFSRRPPFRGGAVVVDTRCGPALSGLPAELASLRKAGYAVELLYLDASDEALVQRFKETRRPHPLLAEVTRGGQNAGIIEAIAAERALLNEAREAADNVLDTSAYGAADLRATINRVYSEPDRHRLHVSITSFGFKHGLPIDADLLFDVRFLRNPHYVEDLRPLDGRHPKVADYVHADEAAAEFIDRMESLVLFTLPRFEAEGKAYLNIAIGCTGGQHRSVVVAEDLERSLTERGYRVYLRHRDIAASRPDPPGEAGA